MDILTLQNSADRIEATGAAIYQAVLAQSRCIRQSNFECIGVDDVALIFGLYDQFYFDGWLGGALKAATDQPMEFRLSRRMTRAGGKTVHYRRRSPGQGCRFEIAISSTMLFKNFGDVQRPVTVGGLTCKDRLDALQRIMEHEIIHLAELLVWEKTSCSAPRFRALALNIFGHRATTHDLVTTHEHAAKHYGVQAGDAVIFEFEGRRLIGRVNRICKRATVLVNDDDGQLYSDGVKYRKYYVPLSVLGVVLSE